MVQIFDGFRVYCWVYSGGSYVDRHSHAITFDIYLYCICVVFTPKVCRFLRRFGLCTLLRSSYLYRQAFFAITFDIYVVLLRTVCAGVECVLRMWLHLLYRQALYFNTFDIIFFCVSVVLRVVQIILEVMIFVINLTGVKTFISKGKTPSISKQLC